MNWHDRPKRETPVAGEPRGPPEDLRVNPEETKERISAAPFADARLVKLPPYHYALVCER